MVEVFRAVPERLFVPFSPAVHKDPFAEVTDTVFLGQGERAIIEFIPRPMHRGGKFLFHAHQSEFIELGWTGIFEVV